MSCLSLIQIYWSAVSALRGILGTAHILRSDASKVLHMYLQSQCPLKYRTLTFTVQPLAFEVPATEESIIRKHPPRRFQRLEDQQMILSHELLDEKQEEARQRRFQVIVWQQPIQDIMFIWLIYVYRTGQLSQ